METQIFAYLKTSKGFRVVTIFGYATRGVPGLEITGLGKMAKTTKEKLIFMTRTRKLSVPTKRFAICVDLNDLEGEIAPEELKFLEFPILLLFWYLAGFLPIKKLDDCVCAGWINTRGEIYQPMTPIALKILLKNKVNPVMMRSLKLITSLEEDDHGLWAINASLLLEHIKDLVFKMDYIDKASAIPRKSFIA